MDQQTQRGRSPSAGQPQPHISPSAVPYPQTPNDTGLGLTLEQSTNIDGFNTNHPGTTNTASNYLSPQQQQQQQTAFAQQTLTDTTLFDPNANYNQQMPTTAGDSTLSFNSQNQPDYLSPNLNDDFSLFPPSTGPGDQYNNQPLFEASTFNPGDMNNMTSPGSHNSPTPPHLLQPDLRQPGSAQHSPSFSQHQFSSPPGGGHSRHTSLGPEAALLPGQLDDWTQQPQFQGHRRSPSAHSDVSSVSPSPNLVSSDSFDQDPNGHSPMQRASDASLFEPVLTIGNFSLSDAVGSPGQQGRSPSHSPAVSPRIAPQPMADSMQHQGYGLAPNMGGYGDTIAFPNMQAPNEAFPTLQHPDMSQMAPPAINIDFAPTNAKLGGFDLAKQQLDQDSLTPPERGKHSLAPVIGPSQTDTDSHWQAARETVLARLRTRTTRRELYWVGRTTARAHPLHSVQIFLHAQMLLAPYLQRIEARLQPPGADSPPQLCLTT